jgi:hypothetical protein
MRVLANLVVGTVAFIAIVTIISAPALILRYFFHKSWSDATSSTPIFWLGACLTAFVINRIYALGKYVCEGPAQ